MTEVDIDQADFEKYFFDVRKHKPQRGQVMACYSAVAYFEAGPEKWQIIDLLRQTSKMEPAAQVMRKLMFAREPDCYRVLIEMAKDLLAMSPEEVEQKSYKYTAHIFYYVEPKYVPKNDPHWTTISIVNLSEFCDLDEKRSAESLDNTYEQLNSVTA